ncbi:MAG: TonB-dependent receptor plug domain-containing protein, partial [Terriglobia bacterium]
LTGFLGSADLSSGASGELSFSRPRLAFLIGGTGRHHNDLRSGNGMDSHHALRRFLGLTPSHVRSLMGSRLEETAFSQMGGNARFNARIRPDQQLTFWYQHSTQRGVRGYKDLWGGQGRLQSAFTPQALNFLYARYEKQGAGELDSLSATFSLNSQRDGLRSQGLLARDPILQERIRVDAYGYSAQARGHRGSHQTFVFGGEFYDERIQSPRLLSRSEAAYRTFGLHGQTSWESPGRRVRALGGGRLTRVGFRERAFGDLTFNTALSFRARESLLFHLVVARGFRAPNVNDLATVGLQDLGYEFPAEAMAGLGALVGSNSGDSAESTGRSVQSLGSEGLMNYETGVSWQTRGSYFRAEVFDAELANGIARRSILFPADRVPTEIAGLRVRALPPTPQQGAQGVVGVATDLDPRIIKAFANIGRQRYRGVELLLRQKLTASLTLSANYAFLAGREMGVVGTGYVRRLPPQQGAVSLFLNPSSRVWVAFGLEAAGAQRRLEGGDVSDERIGASRSRADIARFFAGDRLRPWVRDGVFLPTGESLVQIQERVLPASTVPSDTLRVPLFLTTPGYASAHIRAGFRAAEHSQFTIHLQNLTDRNYRQHGSGVDAPGLHVIFTWELRF